MMTSHWPLPYLGRWLRSGARRPDCFPWCADDSSTRRCFERPASELHLSLKDKRPGRDPHPTGPLIPCGPLSPGVGQPRDPAAWGRSGWRLRPEQRERDDSDSVSSPVSEWAGVYDDAFDEALPQLITQPGQMPDVSVIDRSVQLDLDGDD